MKKVLTFFMACFLMIGLSHATDLNYNSQLSIKLWENASYTITLDDRTYQSTSRFKANNVAHGRHRVRIVRNNSYEPYSWGAGSQLVYDGAIQVPARSIVKTKLAHGSLRIIHVERIPLPAGFCTHGYQMGHCGYGCGAPPVATNNVTCNHGFSFGQCYYGCTMPSGYDMNGNPIPGGFDNGNGYGYGQHGNGGFGNPYGDPYGSNGGNWGNGTGNGGFGNPYGDPYGNGTGNDNETVVFMSDQEFKNLMNTMKNQSFDSKRLMVAQQAFKNNRVSSRQVKKMMELMAFESNRVKLAKAAYPSVADKKNFFEVNNSLTFSSSKKDLDVFVKSRP